MPKKLDRLAELRQQLGPALAPGETLTVAEGVRRSLGADEAADARREQQARAIAVRLGGPPQPRRRRGLLERAAGFVLSAAGNSSPVDLPTPELPDPNGTALRGGPDSRAVWLRDLMGDGDGSCVLAGTSRRWFVLRDDAGAPSRRRALTRGTPLPYAVLAEVPREQVRELRSVPTALARGRVEMRFTDDSMLAVVALGRDRAEALARG